MERVFKKLLSTRYAKYANLVAKMCILVPVRAGEFGHPQIYGEIIEDPARPTIL
jgi:hypothetical protein